MKHKNFYLITFIVLLGIQMGCEQERDKYYDEPSWLSGPLLDQVRAAGEYSEYVALAESVGFESVLNSAGNYTIFVPTNEAFEQYYQENDLTDFNTMSEEERLRLLRYHTVEGSWTREQMLTKTIFGFWAKDGQPDSFKNRTLLREDVFTETSVIDGLPKAIYSSNKYVPIYSNEFLDYLDYQVSDYTYLYPVSEWNGFNMSRAQIIVEELPAENGFFYVIDKVVEPTPTVDRLVNTDSRFEVFGQLTQRLASYAYNESETLNAGGDSLFNKRHNLLIDLADENTAYYSHPTESSGFHHHTVFVPSNEALNNYFSTNFSQYGSIDDIPVDIIQDFVNAHILKERFALPSVLAKGVKNIFGDPITFDTEADVFYREYGANALVYGLNKVIEPNVFFAVTGNLYFNPDYAVFKNMLKYTGLIPTLTNAELEFTVFALSNATLADAGYSFALRPGGDPLNTADFLFFKNDGSDDVLLTQDEVKGLVDLHLLFRQVDVAQAGFAPSFSGPFVGFENNTVFGGGEQEMSASVNIAASFDATNGRLFEVDGLLTAPTQSIEDYILNDPNYAEFRTLCDNAGLITSGRLNLLDVTVGYTACIPTNDVISASSGSIPVDVEELRQFIRYFFLRDEIFTTDTFSENVATERVDTDRSDEFETFFESISVAADGSGIQITDGQGGTTQVVAGQRNVITKNGVIHRLDDLLQF